MLCENPAIFQGGQYRSRSAICLQVMGYGNFIILQIQGKIREFCKIVREILNTKKVKENSGNIEPKLFGYDRYFNLFE